MDYLSELKPIFKERCYQCHAASQQKGGLRLDTAADLLKGGDSGAGFVKGKSSESLIVQAITGTHATISQMPYKKAPLSQEQIERIVRWIDQGGALLPDEAREEKVHWSFIPPTRAQPPALKQEDWPRNTIDRFVLALLEAQNFAPSPEADRHTLIRRLSLDLTGLPPTLAEVDEFVRDTRPDAYDRLVERLLASPHYGERWGRWWLDVARYADSNGYSIDAPRTIWAYRDWVIDALNRDLPFDQFTIDQLAGDLLSEPTLAQKIATGFHRNTQINQEGGIDPEQFRVESVMDRVNTTSTAFLGLTVACAQCHDHKFDPITQREYYELYAFFNNTVEDGHGKGTPGGLLPLTETPEPAESEPAEKKSGRRPPKGPTTLVMEELDKPRESFVFIKGDFTRPGKPVSPGVPKMLPPLEINGSNPPNRLDLARWLVEPQNPLTARVAVNRVWQQYFGRGLVETENDFGTQGIPPTHPELLDWLAMEFMFPHESEARLARSDSASEANAPKAWSLKHIHRLIVTSATYRQSSRVRPDLAKHDPNNKWLARQSRLRLEAEVVRDVGLSASGLLHDKIGGPSVFPPQPDGVMTLGQSRRNWTASHGPDRFRRGLYTFFWRATPHPSLTVFDAPDGFSSCTRRIRSNTPLQALTLLNGEEFFEFAEGLAARILKEGPANDAGRLEYGFRLCVARPPSEYERERLNDLLAQQMLHEQPEEAVDPPEPWVAVARVLLNLDETISRE